MANATTTTRRKPSHPKTLARFCAAAMIEKKAKDVVLLDLRKLTDMTDFFVICTADSDTQLKAIADSVLDRLLEKEIKPWRTEGWNGGQWIILDLIDVVVHVFYKEAREFYKIERLWSDAPHEEITDNVEEAVATQ